MMGGENQEVKSQESGVRRSGIKNQEILVNKNTVRMIFALNNFLFYLS
jgi:hypothetical protein